MAVEKETSNAAEPTAVFLEVLCRSSGKVRRFAPGVKAGFASSLINLKLEPGVPFCLYIEAIKEGEEPISFGPDSVLVIYGNGWKLQTVIDSKGSKRVVDRPVAPTKADTQVLTVSAKFIGSRMHISHTCFSISLPQTCMYMCLCS
ncbi:hypothetical protein Dimus_023157 [Dionaea muscipula]